jgi:hypothetical protein
MRDAAGIRRIRDRTHFLIHDVIRIAARVWHFSTPGDCRKRRHSGEHLKCFVRIHRPTASLIKCINNPISAMTCVR